MENENQIINSCPKRFPYDMKENREIQIPFPVKMTDVKKRTAFRQTCLMSLSHRISNLLCHFTRERWFLLMIHFYWIFFSVLPTFKFQLPNCNVWEISLKWLGTLIFFLCFEPKPSLRFNKYVSEIKVLSCLKFPLVMFYHLT